MGQYRQWLHYRHVAQQLQTQKDQLTTAVKHFQEHIDALNAPPLDANNSIVQALTLYVKTLSASPQESLVEQPVENGHIQQPETISQALFDHSRLEPFHMKDMHEPILPKRPTSSSYTPIPSNPHKPVDLVPEATDTFPDEHGQTEPQVALPWWLRKTGHSEGQDNTLDAQSVRTNLLVQRWLERWRRQEEQEPQSAQANEQQTNLQQEGKQ